LSAAAATHLASKHLGIDSDKMTNILHKASNIKDIKGLSDFITKDQEVKDFTKDASDRIGKKMMDNQENLIHAIKRNPGLANAAFNTAGMVKNAAKTAKEIVTHT
jgi:hypothetical protein